MIWITGAAGSGKTTIARRLHLSIPNSVVLDGDEVRQWLTPELGFSLEDRLAHLVRVQIVGHLIEQVGGTAIIATVTVDPNILRNVFVAWLVGRERHPPWDGTTWPEPPHHDLKLDTSVEDESQCTRHILNAVRAPECKPWFCGRCGIWHAWDHLCQADIAPDEEHIPPAWYCKKCQAHHPAEYVCQ